MNPLLSVKGSLITGIRRSPSCSLCSAVDGGVEFNELGLGPLAAHHRRHHLDRPPLLLQRRAGAGSRGSRRRQGRPGRRGHHQVRRPAGAPVVSLGGGRDLVHRRLVPVARRNLRRRLHARARRRRIQFLRLRDRHRHVARHDHAVQRLGLHLAEPEEDPRLEARRPTSRKPRRARPRCTPRGSTTSCRSRCCCAWRARRTGCPSSCRPPASAGGRNALRTSIRAGAGHCPCQASRPLCRGPPSPCGSWRSPPDCR